MRPRRRSCPSPSWCCSCAASMRAYAYRRCRPCARACNTARANCRLIRMRFLKALHTDSGSALHQAAALVFRQRSTGAAPRYKSSSNSSRSIIDIGRALRPPLPALAAAPPPPPALSPGSSKALLPPIGVDATAPAPATAPVAAPVGDGGTALSPAPGASTDGFSAARRGGGLGLAGGGGVRAAASSLACDTTTTTTGGCGLTPSARKGFVDATATGKGAARGAASGRNDMRVVS